MRSPKAPFVIAAAVALAGCGGAEKRKLVVQPPATISQLEQLPVQSPDRSLLFHSASPGDAKSLLIARARALYSAGVRDSRSGDLQGAQRSFDGALSLLLESDYNLESGQRLRTEFHKLVDDIYRVEAEAQQRDEGLGTRQREREPRAGAADLTFPVDPKAEERAGPETQHALPLASNEHVDEAVGLLLDRRREFLNQMLARSGLYEPIISKELRREGLPQDLMYLAGAESAFDPLALSRKGANGIWQLMLSRAREYGLNRNRWIDERQDPVKSTQAAVRHLKDLYQTFGDWYLAIAAYNCGPGYVRRAIQQTGYADFWTLRELGALPRETLNYVPTVLAATLIARDPQAYGIDVLPSPPLTTEQAVTSVPTHLRLVAQLIDRPVEELVRLNPGLLRMTTPPNDPEFVLNLPAGTRETYEQAITKVPPKKRASWRAHKIHEGETLSAIARKYRLSTLALARANGLEKGARLEPGAHLILPFAPGRDLSIERVRAEGPWRLYRYRVRRGDTLIGIANRFGVTVRQIRQWNGIEGSLLIAGEVISLYVPARPATGPVTRRTRPPRTTKSSSPPEKQAASSRTAAPTSVSRTFSESSLHAAQAAR